jgi:hypothetical protein
LNDHQVKQVLIETGTCLYVVTGNDIVPPEDDAVWR